MKKKKTADADEILLYKEKGGQTAVEVRFQGETAWLALNQIADLFQRDKSVISRHLRNIFETGELLKNRVVAKNATTAADGKTYQVEAAHLLYFIIKDHPFIDGNKRIGSLLFILFLAKNRSLYRANGEAKINDNALVALALLIAESDPGHKDVLVKLVINLLWEAAT